MTIPLGRSPGWGHQPATYVELFGNRRLPQFGWSLVRKPLTLDLRLAELKTLGRQEQFLGRQRLASQRIMVPDCLMMVDRA